MSDEPIKEEPKIAEWKMPEPVYRSSPGKTPDGAPFDDPQEEIPTEPGFADMETEENVEIPAALSDDEASEQAVRPSTKTRIRHKKKGGCAKTFVTLIGVVAVIAIAVLSALIYLLFYYRPGETGTF